MVSLQLFGKTASLEAARQAQDTYSRQGQSYVTDLEGTISVDKSTILLLDIGHKDNSKLCSRLPASIPPLGRSLTHAETRSLLTMPEIRDELWKSVFGGDARAALLDGGARIGAF